VLSTECNILLAILQKFRAYSSCWPQPCMCLCAQHIMRTVINIQTCTWTDHHIEKTTDIKNTKLVIERVGSVTTIITEMLQEVRVSMHAAAVYTVHCICVQMLCCSQQYRSLQHTCCTVAYIATVQVTQTIEVQFNDSTLCCAVLIPRFCSVYWCVSDHWITIKDCVSTSYRLTPFCHRLMSICCIIVGIMIAHREV
jgi:hypothetical protein